MMKVSEAESGARRGRLLAACVLQLAFCFKRTVLRPGSIVLYIIIQERSKSPRGGGGGLVAVSHYSQIPPDRTVAAVAVLVGNFGFTFRL